MEYFTQEYHNNGSRDLCHIPILIYPYDSFVLLITFSNLEYCLLKVIWTIYILIFLWFFFFWSFESLGNGSICHCELLFYQSRHDFAILRLQEFWQILYTHRYLCKLVL